MYMHICSLIHFIMHNTNYWKKIQFLLLKSINCYSFFLQPLSNCRWTVLWHFPLQYAKQSIESCWIQSFYLILWSEFQEWNSGACCPQRLGHLSPWRLSGSIWTKPWAVWSDLRADSALSGRQDYSPFQPGLFCNPMVPDSWKVFQRRCGNW